MCINVGCYVRINMHAGIQFTCGNVHVYVYRYGIHCPDRNNMHAVHELTWSKDCSFWCQFSTRCKCSITTHAPSSDRRGSWCITNLLHLACSLPTISNGTDT